VARGIAQGITFWVPASQARAFALIYPSATFTTQVASIEQPPHSREEALLELVRGWMSHIGPIDEAALAQTLGLAKPDVQQALLGLETLGVVLRGQYTGSQETEWCERRLLMRIHRLTLGILRREIQPVTPAEFMRWLLRWQHLAPGTQVFAERGALEVMRQLQGFEAPASAWEPQILARRIAAYDPEILDQLCLTGAVGWGRVSPHPAFSSGPESHGNGEGLSTRRVTPTSAVPITFFVRDDGDWMTQRETNSRAVINGLSHPARDVHAYLHTRGASFFGDIVRGSGRLKSEVEMALWELVSAGLVTADGFDNLRAFLDPKRRAGQGRGRSTRPRNSAGRWSLLHTDDSPNRPDPVEAVARVLLNRYGVVFRELLARENFPVRWRELLMTLRRLEDRGEVRGGRFVDGFLGEQFALPLAVESVRAARKVPASGERVTVSAADPLNLVGIIVPGDRVAANSGRSILFCDGIPAIESKTPNLILA
jgi:ATP-dependent Lhr-like helicase